ncbi:MAG: hypothetical protein JHC93_02960 [Parachlamydiales bacterium]|nr:hypothetical protein [Parachlamydiales bacterium]
MDDHYGDMHVDSTSLQIHLRKEQIDRATARQVASKEAFVEACEDTVNPLIFDKNKEKFKKLDDRSQGARTLAAQKAKIFDTQKTLETAQKYEQQNPELSSRSLTALFQSLGENDSAGTILQKVMNFFPDVALADEAMEFLAEVAVGQLQQSVKEAKEEHTKRFKRQIVAGRNIAQQAREFSEKGLGSPTALRELYDEITHNPREPLDLFEEFAGKYPFEKLAPVIQFMLHSLGADLNSKGTSIESAELYQLLNEARTLQAILGVYRFFKGRMGLINRYFKRKKIPYPTILNFELLAKQFVKLAQDRYPSPLKILQVCQTLNIDDLNGMILVNMQLRDAIRGLSPRIYKNDKQKNDLINAFIGALEELEDRLDAQENPPEKADDEK